MEGEREREREQEICKQPERWRQKLLCSKQKDCKICHLIAYHKQAYNLQFKHLFLTFTDN
jgi:hypothetical protein